jgi:hypothetical protein
VSFRDKMLQSMKFSKTKVRPKELTPREMVVEELNKQRKLLSEGKTTGCWWDKENDVVTISVRGATYFNEKSSGGLSGRLYGDDFLGKAWTKGTVNKFINDFETALHNNEFVADTKWWHQRYQAKISGSKGRTGKSTVKGKGSVTKKK